MGNTSIIQETKANFLYGGELVNGGAVRYLSLVVVYDDRGPFITNYTAAGSHTWGFETKRRISSKPVEVPDWTNESGFIVKDGYDRFYGGYPYTLYIHRDNIRDEDYEPEEWCKYEVGAVKQRVSIGGCEFLRIISNGMLDEAKDAYSKATEYEFPYCGSFPNQKELNEAIAACKEIIDASESMKAAIARVNCLTLDELLKENGAYGPLNKRDYCGILNESSHVYREYLDGTYELEGE